MRPWLLRRCRSRPRRADVAPLVALEVRNMASGHDVRRITAAIRRTDPAAKVSVRLHLRLVRIDGGAAGAQELLAAVQAAGYDAAVLDSDNVTKW